MGLHVGVGSRAKTRDFVGGYSPLTGHLVLAHWRQDRRAGNGILIKGSPSSEDSPLVNAQCQLSSPDLPSGFHYTGALWQCRDPACGPRKAQTANFWQNGATTGVAWVSYIRAASERCCTPAGFHLPEPAEISWSIFLTQLYRNRPWSSAALREISKTDNKRGNLAGALNPRVTSLWPLRSLELRGEEYGAAAILSHIWNCPIGFLCSPQYFPRSSATAPAQAF